MNYLQHSIKSNNQGLKTSYIVVTQYFQVPSQFNNQRSQYGPTVLIVAKSPDLKIDYYKIQQYLDIAFGCVDNIYFVSIRLIQETYEDVIFVEITDDNQTVFYLRFVTNSSEYIFGKMYPYKTQILRNDFYFNDHKQTVVKDQPELGYYKATMIGCKVCKYYDPTELISCTLHPKSRFENVVGCIDYERVE